MTVTAFAMVAFLVVHLKQGFHLIFHGFPWQPSKQKKDKIHRRQAAVIQFHSFDFTALLAVA